MENRDNTAAKKKSALITLIVGIMVLLLLFTYTWTIKKPEPNIEIAVLFDNEELPEPPEEPIVPKPIIKSNSNSSASQKNASSNRNASAKGKTNSSKYRTNPRVRSQTQKDNSPVSAAPNSADKNLDREENASNRQHQNTALDNLMRGRNQGGGSDGDNSNGRIRGSRTDGNGSGQGNGEGVVGQGGRYLISKVPGTMGDNSPPLPHNCDATGTVKYAYKVNASGNVTSVYRIGGASNSCLVNLGLSRIKSKVKANKANTSAKGTYSITFK